VRLLGALLAIVALIAVACGDEQAMEATPPTTPEPPAETTTTTTTPDTSRPAAPPIEGETLDGEALALADFRGQPVLVNVWSSW
jgi:hypothetical protein